MKKIKLSSVIVGDRLRKEMGDVDDLARSIREEGLMEPIVLSSDNRLVAGGRRFAAHQLLAQTNGYYDEIAYVTIEDELRASGKIGPDEIISESRLRLLEIEENVRRESMTWKERVQGIYEYHRLNKHEHAKNGDKWTQSMTGRELGVSQAHVSPIMSIAQELKNPESIFHQCSSLSEALQLKVKIAADEATKLLAQKVKAGRAKIDSKAPIGKLSDSIIVDFSEKKQELESIPQEDDFDFNSIGQSPLETLTQPASNDLVSLSDISQLYFQGDGIEMMYRFAETSTIHHIITDPPYGIDTRNMARRCDSSRSALIDRIASTHKVDENVKLLADFLAASYDCIHESGFLCMWYDLDHHNFLCDVANEIGWTVCRWPFHWVKTSPCANQAAQYNMTKAVEHCLILRRSTKSLIVERGRRNYIIEASDSSATHPFYKPYNVWKALIEIVSREGQTLFDPFCGEGSMLVPAFTLGRIPYGAELDETHIANGIRSVTERINRIGLVSKTS